LFLIDFLEMPSDSLLRRSRPMPKTTLKGCLHTVLISSNLVKLVCLAYLVRFVCLVCLPPEADQPQAEVCWVIGFVALLGLGVGWVCWVRGVCWVLWVIRVQRVNSVCWGYPICLLVD